MKATFLILAALIGAPQPAPAYNHPIGGETAAAMLQTIINNGGETAAAPAEDYNGDGLLNIADYTGSSRRHHITAAGNEVTADGETVAAIAAEIFPSENLIYYEFDFVGGQVCRRYEVTAAEITATRIYFEFEDWSTSAAAEINPYTESITIF